MVICLKVFFNGPISNFIVSDGLNQSPSIKVVENEEEYLLEITMSGLKKDDVELGLEKGLLRVFAEKEDTEKRFTRKEFDYASFQRTTLVLP